MTKMTISGLEKMIDDMERMSSNFKPMAEGILKDGAQIIVGEWKREASKRTLKITGKMIDSINYKKRIKKDGSGIKTDIVPMGRDDKGVRNAEKAFILHYGTSPRRKVARRKGKYVRPKKYPGAGIPALHWVDDAEAAAEPIVEKKVLDTYDKWLQMHGYK
jgi:HK97 gp10 family phage protein